MTMIHKGLVLALAICAVGACQGAAKLDGAINTIPVYKPTSLEDFASAHTSDDFSNWNKFSAYSWDLRTKHSWDKVDAFYQSRLAGAQRDDVAAEDGEKAHIRYVWVPQGSKDGENVTVHVYKDPVDGKTRLWIHETVLSGRRKGH